MSRVGYTQGQPFSSPARSREWCHSVCAMRLPMVTTMLYRGTLTGMVVAGSNTRRIRFPYRETQTEEPSR